MIRITKEENKIIIKGHSGYDISGKDIVCASVSSIVTTTVNGILRLMPDAITFEKEDGYLEISIIKHTDIVDTLIENMMDLFYQLEQQYTKYIKIMR